MSESLHAPYPRELRYPDGSSITFGRIGRSFLGHYLLSEFVWMARDPMGPCLRFAWARAVQRNAKRAIREYGEINGGSVDVDEIMSKLNGEGTAA